MKAIILSAGQGRRLLPHTASVPKCLLPVDGERTLLDAQLHALARCGVRRAVVMVGFGADRVDAHLAANRVRGIEVETRFNPFYAISDNLITCWLAARDMDGDFVLVNGDTLFGPVLLQRVLSAPDAPITVTTDRKAAYDDDDMKVSLAGRRLCAIGKQLGAIAIDGEAIGMIRVRALGVTLLRDALDAAVRRPDAQHAWYLSVVNQLAAEGRVDTVSIEGEWWGEVDSPDDLARVRAAYDAARARRERVAASGWSLHAASAESV